MILTRNHTVSLTSSDFATQGRPSRGWRRRTLRHWNFRGTGCCPTK